MQSELERESKDAIKSPFKEIGKDIVYYIPAKLVPGMVGFLELMAYTRLLNPEQYGLYALTTTTVSIVLAASLRWISGAGLRYFEEYKRNGKLSQFISTGSVALLACFLSVGLIFFAVTFLLERYINNNIIYLLRIGIIVLASKAGYFFVISIVRAERKSLLYGIYSSVNALGRLILAIILLSFLPLGPEGILVAIIIVTGGISVFELIQFNRRWGIDFLSFSFSLLRKFASYGIPLIGVAFGALVLAQSDRYMIEYFIGSEGVGIYSVGYDISDKIIKIFFSILTAAAYPVIIQVFEQKGEKETGELLKKLLGVYFILLTPMVFGIAALSEDIVSILLGGSFQKAASILPWVAGGVFFLGLTQIVSKPFELRKKTLYLLYLIVFAAILNIILNLFFIPKFGIVGAAFSTLISYLIYLIFSWSISSKSFRWIFPWNSFGKAILATVVMYSVLILIPSFSTNFLTLLLKVSFGMIIYFVLLAFLKESLLLSVLKYSRNSLIRF